MKPYEGEVYFCDEMRYGTRSESKRRWTRQGRRPKCPIKIGYQWSYLYAAICPFEGELFTMLYPNMKKEGFEHFGWELQAYLRAKNKGQKTLLIGDKATAHQAKLLPKELIWQSLPTACPELNPVERFFEELRKVLANRIFDSIEQVEETLIFYIKKWEANPEKLKKLTLFPYIRQK